jgi:hypothetical protein
LQIALLFVASFAEDVLEAACAGFSADPLDVIDVSAFGVAAACLSLEGELQPGTAREHIAIVKRKLVVDFIIQVSS